MKNICTVLLIGLLFIGCDKPSEVNKQESEMEFVSEIRQIYAQYVFTLDMIGIWNKNEEPMYVIKSKAFKLFDNLDSQIWDLTKKTSDTRTELALAELSSQITRARGMFK